jgi:uncharacterized protein (DUF2132 family)
VKIIRLTHHKDNITDTQMNNEQPNNILHGITLEMMLTTLVEQYGWKELGKRIAIKCFTDDPGIKSSLKFLRRTPWARKKVEDLYLRSTKKVA